MDLISYNNISSSSRHPFLKVPIAKTSSGQRAFSVSAPRLWNALPNNLKELDNLSVFKNKLKSHLFPKSYNI